MPHNKQTNVRAFIGRTAAFAIGSLFPSAASRLFEAIVLTPTRFRSGGPAGLPGAEKHVVDTPVGPIRYWTSGNGPPVLFVHGWNADASSWADLSQAVSRAGLRAVAFDAPAHGNGPRHRTNVVQIKHALMAVAEQVGPVKGLVGHSIGGLAAALAAEAGLAVPNIALISAPADLARITLNIGAELGFPPRVASDLLDRLEQRLGLRWESVRMPGVVSRLDQRILVVHDEDDRQIHWKEGELIAQSAVRGDLLLTSQLGHNRILTSPVVAERLVEFLTSPSNDSPGFAQVGSERGTDASTP